MAIKTNFGGVPADKPTRPKKSKSDKLEVLDKNDKNTIFNLIFADEPEKKTDSAK